MSVKQCVYSVYLENTLLAFKCQSSQRFLAHCCAEETCLLASPRRRYTPRVRNTRPPLRQQFTHAGQHTHLSKLVANQDPSIRIPIFQSQGYILNRGLIDIL